jgi:hypothetical protein
MAELLNLAREARAQVETFLRTNGGFTNAPKHAQGIWCGCGCHKLRAWFESVQIP